MSDHIAQSVLTRTRRPRGSDELSVRTFRTDDLTWERARARATRDGMSISRVVATLLDGYARGHIDLPEIHFVYKGRGEERQVAR